jgi:large subunit ribosomal protein L4
MEQAKVVNNKVKVISDFPFNAAIWETPLSTWNISLANRYYLANQAQGTSKVKTRGEVAGSTRKIYKQKGTGRARHGPLTAPQFRGGGVAFGPRGGENHSLNINKKEKDLAMRIVLAEKKRQEKMFLLNEIILDNFKTQEAEKLLINLLYKDLKSQIEKLKQEIKELKTTDQKKQLAEKEKELTGLKKKMKQKTKTLIVLASNEKNKEKITRSFRNMPTVSFTDSRQVNFSHLFNNSQVIFSCEEAITELEKRLIKN